MRKLDLIIKGALVAPWPRFVTSLSLIVILVGIPLAKDWPSLWRLLIADTFFLVAAFCSMCLYQHYLAPRRGDRRP